MLCENILCIYCDEGKCILDCVSIDSVGLCSECILIRIDDDKLNEIKEKILRELKNNN